jgi:hypothetical protein
MTVATIRMGGVPDCRIAVVISSSGMASRSCLSLAYNPTMRRSCRSSAPLISDREPVAVVSPSSITTLETRESSHPDINSSWTFRPTWYDWMMRT